jgi:hypothetical protein
MTAASAEEVAELLGERAEESIVERIAAVGASVDEIHEAVDDLDFQLRFGEPRPPSSPHVKDVRAILEELPYFEDLLDDGTEEDEEYEGLTVVEAEDLNPDNR